MMAQIPYVCGRLGELAQDIRWRTDQFPALREAGGAAELRQIAQHLQKLVSALREAALLLEEAGLHEAAAYTAQLSAATSAFHIRTEDYSRLTAAFDDWLQRMTPLLPDTETKTVDAAVIGRLMNQVRLGYYPTEAAHVGWLKAALRFPESKAVNLLDPCCGEGDALQQLGAGENAVTYGAELDESRAEAAQSVLDHVAIGSYYFARISRSAFHLLFLNPPYLQMYGGARSEKRFLGESYDHLMMGGVLIYIIPYYRLTDDVCSFLAAHFDRLMAYRFCGEEFKKFRQIAILGVRKPRAENPRMAGLLEMVSLHPDKLPTLDHIPPENYPLPDAEKAISLFQGAQFNVRELAEQMRRMGSMLPKRSALDGQEKRPPLPLTIGQIGLVGGSGLINGLIECETPHVIKGQVIKSTRRRTGDQYEECDGRATTEIIETTSNKMVFNLLTPDGVKLLA